MAAPRGKRLALLAGTVAVLALVIAVVAAKDRLREEWYIRQLSSADEEIRVRAAATLGGMKSVRAVPELIRLIKERESRELTGQAQGEAPVEEEVEDDIEKPAREPEIGLLSDALIQIGSEALPMLSKERENPHAQLAWVAARIEDSLKPPMPPEEAPRFHVTPEQREEFRRRREALMEASARKWEERLKTLPEDPIETPDAGSSDK